METISFESSHESVVTLFSAGSAKRCTDRPRIVPGIAIRAMTRMTINGQRRRRDRERISEIGSTRRTPSLATSPVQRSPSNHR